MHAIAMEGPTRSRLSGGLDGINHPSYAAACASCKARCHFTGTSRSASEHSAAL